MSISLQTRNTNSDFPLVAPLTDFDRNSLALVGGKGANLGELIKAGFHVPPGFVITTAAYDLLLQTNDLQSHLQNALALLQADDPASLKEVSTRIHSAIRDAAIPDQIRDAVINAYREMRSDAIAVRSSATAEDLPGAAFAGQQETFLNVIGEQALLDAIHACWASLWSERAILYRAHHNVGQTSVKLAVVVQEMVPADVAGVMFTANPVSGARDELVIDANPGLGEAVVGGLVTPDHFVINKHRFKIKEQRIGKREIMIQSKTGGGTEEITLINKNTELTLSASALRNLAKVGIQIERHYGAPQDVEWAWINNEAKVGKFLILQARPMTALPDPIKISGPMRMVIPMLAEMWPSRPYPLDITTFTGVLERAVGSFLSVMIGKSAPDPDKAMIEEEGVVVHFEPPEVHPSPSMLVAPWLALWRTRHYDPSQWQADPIIIEVIAKVSELEKRDLRSLTWEQNIDTLRESLALIPRVMELRERYFPQALLGLGTLWLLVALTGQKNSFGKLISGVKTKTTETNRALETLAAQIRSNTTLHELFANNDVGTLSSKLGQSQAGKDLLQSLAAFLNQYGHRETALTISQPAWRDEPKVVLEILKVLATAEQPEANHYQEWKQTRDELVSRSILRRWPLRKLFLKSLTNARSLLQIREDTHFYATLAQPLVRRVALELGRRLEQAGAVNSLTDIFHLKLDELEGLGKLSPPSAEPIAQIQALVARRSAKRESLANKPMFDPRLLEATSQGSADEDVILSGSPGSPGIASGPVRIVLDVSEFGKLQSGDVLVAPVTNPAWTPLFQRAVAIVVDMGGAASHAAIVAREYGIPAVMGTMSGTQQLRDGQWIQVDGSRGLVLKAESPAKEREPEKNS
jgi:phosphohistidine swiveling domain-containing protein